MASNGRLPGSMSPLVAPRSMLTSTWRPSMPCVVCLLGAACVVAIAVTAGGMGGTASVSVPAKDSRDVVLGDAGGDDALPAAGDGAAFASRRNRGGGAAYDNRESASATRPRSGAPSPPPAAAAASSQGAALRAGAPTKRTGSNKPAGPPADAAQQVANPFPVWIKLTPPAGGTTGDGYGRTTAVHAAVGGRIIPGQAAQHTTKATALDADSILDVFQAPTYYAGDGEGRAAQNLRRRPLLVLLHGATPAQDIYYWQSLFAGIASIADYIILEFPNHGDTPRDQAADPDDLMQGLLETLKPVVRPDRRPGGLALLGRSWGGARMMVAVARAPREVRRLMSSLTLIAPAANQAIVQAFPADTGLEPLIVWNKDDTTIKFQRSGAVSGAFASFTPLYFEAGTTPNLPGVGTHNPELGHAPEFLSALQETVEAGAAKHASALRHIN